MEVSTLWHQAESSLNWMVNITYSIGSKLILFAIFVDESCDANVSLANGSLASIKRPVGVFSVEPNYIHVTWNLQPFDLVSAIFSPPSRETGGPRTRGVHGRRWKQQRPPAVAQPRGECGRSISTSVWGPAAVRVAKLSQLPGVYDGLTDGGAALQGVQALLSGDAGPGRYSGGFGGPGSYCRVAVERDGVCLC